MDHLFPVCRSVLRRGEVLLFDRLLAAPGPDGLAASLAAQVREGLLPAFLPDLLRLEEMVAAVTADAQAVSVVDRLAVNPTLRVLTVDWAGLDAMMTEPSTVCRPAPSRVVMVWRPPGTDALKVQEAKEMELLALKVVVEDLRETTIAADGSVAVGLVDAALDQAVLKGIVLRPPSALVRPLPLSAEYAIPAEFLSAKVFTLQWHITQACDLHCKHCYDRSPREVLPLVKAMAVLDDFRDFCRRRFVRGQVTFTGGNPLLYPQFMDLYRGAVERYLGVAILGNPAPRHQLEPLTDIAKPLFYQVSLEGLAAHNDHIRGRGHFARVMEFLELLRELGIYSMVMLTLTRDNQEQVLPLAELLRGKVDFFTFNRLAMVGEATRLQGPAVDSYPEFLRQYLEAAQGNPGMGLKENLFNIILSARSEGEVFGGCAGHGCGAAFNFVSILADGEVHACRKFPSPIGNIFSQRLAAIYDSAPAAGYRQGSVACQGCRIRPVCGGCLAVVHGLGHAPLLARDPYCFMAGMEAG